jgi:hypothetical protein
MVFEIEVLKGIFGREAEEITGEWRKNKTYEL